MKEVHIGGGNVVTKEKKEGKGKRSVEAERREGVMLEHSPMT
jgi:hypothetical protein